MAKISFDMSGFEELEKQLKKDYTVRVGIMGSKATATHRGSGKKSLTNAEVGTFHEQPNNDGKKLPKRSFLEEPLKKNLYKWISDNTQEFSRMLSDFKIREVFTAIGIEATNIVDNAFATNGHNTGTGWAPLSESTEKAAQRKYLKKHKTLRNYQQRINILTLTGQLRKSITYKVVENK